MLPSHLFWIFLTNSLSQRDLYEAWAARLMIAHVWLGRTRSPPILSDWRARQDYGSFFRCQTAPWKYSYMLGGMVSLCLLAMCFRTISEYRKRSPQMRQCHWSRAKMYGRHSEPFGSSLGSGILIISRRRAFRRNHNPKSTISVR